MLIRNGQQSDASQIAALSGQLGYEAGEEEIRSRLAVILQDDDHAVFVMEDAGKLAGWAHVHGRHLVESAKFAEISGLVVDSGYRRQGIGERLVRSCEEWAQSKGYAEVRVRSNATRLDAHAFYERIGFQTIKSQQVFKRVLGDRL